MEATEVTVNHVNATDPRGAALALLNDARSQAASPLPLPLFALIIGINDYVYYDKLTGAVADAKSVKEYFEEVIRVPGDHIRTLLNGEATREGIINAFRDIQHDKRIREGDPIVIYYSGHGGEVIPPLTWREERKIQCLIPHDCKPTDELTNKPINTYPIPDRSVGALIQDIAREKGDNITVIFDCCYSASGTRGKENQDRIKYVPRRVLIEHRIPDNLDSEVWAGRAGVIPGEMKHHGLKSHILLAACGEKELAYEHEGRGLFTTALLTVLKQSNISDLNYTDVIAQMHFYIPEPFRQNPHCEGDHRHRFLFDAKVSGQVRHSVREIDGFKYFIPAGLAHGVSRGVELTVYSDRKQRENVIVVDDTAMIDDFQTIVTIPVHLQADAFAKLSRVGKVPFYLAPGDDIPPLLREALQGMDGNTATATNFCLVENIEEAKLMVAVEDERAVFKTLDRRVNEFGLTTLPHTATLNNVAHILSAAAHYHWYLDLTNKNIRVLKEEVFVDFYPLQTDYDDYGVELFFRDGPGCRRKDPNSSNPESDIIDFVVDQNAIYGIEIKNNTALDLFVNAFLFNNGSLSIDPYYTQSSAGNPEAPLKGNETLTLGYGSGGTVPFAYSLEPGQDVDVSHLKIFFATRPIDMSDVTQTSPFLDLKGRNRPEELERKVNLSCSPIAQAIDGSENVWFTISIPVVQRRQ